MDPETIVFQAADGEDLVILACTIFDWSTRVTVGQTDGCDAVLFSVWPLMAYGK